MQKFENHRQHDLNSEQVRARADLVSHHSQDIQKTHAWLRTTMYVEPFARFVQSSSTCQVVPMWISLIMFPSGCFSSSPDATACRSAICSSSPGSTSTSPAPRSSRDLFLSVTRSVLATLSHYAFILAFPVQVLSKIVLISSRLSLLCGSIALPCDASADQPESARPNRHS